MDRAEEIIRRWFDDIANDRTQRNGKPLTPEEKALEVELLQAIIADIDFAKLTK